jgi:hypothetical protein
VVATRLRSLVAAAWHYVVSAPLTYSWLAALLVTTLARRFLLTKHESHTVVVDGSTNIHHLLRDPLEVLIDSLLWIDGRHWTPYLVLFTLFLAPAEQWLGHLRWITVGLTAHVGATYVSEGLLALAIDYHQAPHKLVNAADIGVSYFLVGVMAVLTYRIARPWRWGYLAILLLIFGFPLMRIDLDDPNFTAIGHFSSLLIGLCFYPMARDRGRPALNPAKLSTAFRRVRSREAGT